MQNYNKKNTLSIVIPVLNEKQNLKKLTYQIYKNTKNLKIEVIFVDDNSRDGSDKILKKLKQKYSNFKYFIRKKNNDLTQSCFYGVEKSKHKYVLIMDGDGQHDPKYIKKIYKIFFKKKADFVIGVRKFEDIDESLSFIRFFASKILIFLISFLFKKKTTDPMSGFFLFKKKFYVRNKNFFFGKGYKILADFIYSTPEKLKIIDYKIKFIIRKKGKSKISFKILMILIFFIFSRTFKFNR